MTLAMMQRWVLRGWATWGVESMPSIVTTKGVVVRMVK